MSDSAENKVLFTIADDGKVGMFPSAEAIESALAPSDTEGTRVFMEDAGELDIQVELRLPDEFAIGRWQLNQRPIDITTLLMPNELTHDPDFLRRSLIQKFPELPVNTAMPLAEVVEAVKHHTSYGFH